MIVILGLFASSIARAQSSSQVTDQTIKTAPVPPRFEIVQSPLAAKSTFKLDTYTGDMYVLVVDTDKVYSWQHIRKVEGLIPDIVYPNYRNYSFFISSLAIRYDYLMNVNTGAVWQYVIEPKTKELFFEPMGTQ